MASLYWLLLLLIAYLQEYPAQTIYECEPMASFSEICTIQNVQLATPKDIYQIELPAEQKYFHLIDGDIPNFGKQIYDQLEETTNLTITNCKLEQLFVGDLLVHLNASHNQLTTVEFSRTTDYSSLKVLDLSHNNFTRLPNVKTFVYLEELDLSNNAIDLPALNVLMSLTNLKKLNLANNRIHSFSSSLELKALSDLRLSNNTLTEFTAENWNLPSLTNLDLSWNRLFYLNAEDLRRAFPALSGIDLAGNQWNCRGMSPVVQFLNARSIAYHPPSSSPMTCDYNQTTPDGVCCDESYLGYVTLQTQWDIRKLRHDMATMNATLVAELAQVRAEQSDDIGALERQLDAQEHLMMLMGAHLVQMAQLVENLLEEVFLRQSEAELRKQHKHSKERTRPAMLIF